MSKKTMQVLVLNAGSSSIKFELFIMPQEKGLMRGNIENIGQPGSAIKDHYEALKLVLDKINACLQKPAGSNRRIAGSGFCGTVCIWSG